MGKLILKFTWKSNDLKESKQSLKSVKLENWYNLKSRPTTKVQKSIQDGYWCQDTIRYTD